MTCQVLPKAALLLCLLMILNVSRQFRILMIACSFKGTLTLCTTGVRGGIYITILLNAKSFECPDAKILSTLTTK